MTVWRWALRDARRSALGWSVGVLAVVALTTALYPSVKGQTEIDELVRNLPEAVRAMIGVEAGVPVASPAGYLNARLFTLFVPLLFVMFSISAGARAIGGSEADGTLELLLAQPVTRRRVLLERYLSVLTLLGGVAAVFVGALLATAVPVGLLDGVPAVRVVGASVAAGLLALLHGTVAFAAGARWGRPGPATALAAAVATGGYLLHSLAQAAAGLRPLAAATPWHWYGDQNLIRAGVPAAAVAGPLLLSGVLLAVAVWAFERRDLG